MKLIQKTTLALAVLAVAGTSFAQTTASSNGLLGQRYAELGFGLQDIRHISNNAYNLGASVNAPVVPSLLDAGVSYSYGWMRGAFSSHANTIGTYATAYAPMHGVKPFVSAGLGYQWTSARFVGSDDQALWGASVGVEIPAGVVTLTPRISYADDFEGSRRSSQEWSYAVEANYWVDAKTSVFGSIGKTDVRHSTFDYWTYQVGVRVKF